MIPEILKYVSNRDNYYAARSFIPRESLPKEAQQYFDFLDDYFKVYESKGSDVDYETYINAWKFTHGGTLEPLLEKLIANVNKAEVKDSGVVQVLIDKITAFDMKEVSQGILEDDDKCTISKLEDLLLDHESQSVMLESRDHDLSSESFEVALSKIHRTGYSWPLELLNELLGPLNNEFIIVGARPDGGKTAMLLHCAWHIASQMKDDEKVLWFNNEEHIRMIKLRMLQSISGLTKDDVLDNLVDVIRTIKDTMFDFEKRIVFVDNANDIRQIQKAVRVHKPSLVVIDQLFKVRGQVSGKDGNEAERYRRICEWARNVAKNNCPVLVSSQLDFNAEGERYPTMDSLYMSKTGAQGEADAILLIGSVKSEPDKRYLYTPKNKLTGSVKEKEAYILKNVTRFKDV
jgi:hypothetical protein